GTIISAVDTSKIDPRYLRQIVDYQTDEPVGTIIVDPQNRFLYLVMEGGKAMRYGVGVAKAGLEFEGQADILRKAAWPGWVPTPDMIKREPERYGPYAKGLDGGRSEEHTSELQSRENLVCRLLLVKKKRIATIR